MSNAFANNNLNNEKAAFYTQASALVKLMSQSSQQISQHVQNINKRQQALLKKRNPNNTAKEKQCLKSMVLRLSTEQQLGRHFIQTLAASQKQVLDISWRSKQVISINQLKQLSIQGKKVTQHLDTVSAGNRKKLLDLAKKTQTACAKLD